MKNRKPSWWLLYLSMPVVLGLMILLHTAHLADGVEEIGDITMIVLALGAMLAWVQINEGAIIRSDAEREWWASDMTITEYPAREDVQIGRESPHSAAKSEPMRQPAQPTAAGESEREGEIEKWPAS